MPWLMKAEPDTRIVKGKDVKFSVDDFESMGESPWDGVRSHEAKNIMKEKMKLGDKVLFYHSNCKVPGVYALAEISKEGYPDSDSPTSSHPYYDAKSDESNPTWYMVSVRFIKRLEHPVTLSSVKSLVGKTAPPEPISYIGTAGLKAIQNMALINRGRLSVQPVEQEAYDAIVALGEKGGFEEDAKAPKKRTPKEDKDAGTNAVAADGDEKPAAKKAKTESKPKATKAEPKPKAAPKAAAPPPPSGTRRSTRLAK
ncbi:hypothetical protein VHUM_03746 [Vanrija humicola]|uniref:EVE domain-containing protein n=1 Tax=Vanrija humicola TaxID=5417 RepID=A0A7D8Z099_VANHU|nr:hypothetical protein VHUM_03746 [Vanrija humicola]